MLHKNERPAPSITEHGPIAIRQENGTQLVDARELHQFLESKQEFSNWIKKRIRDYGFIENQDYTSFDKIIKRENKRKGSTVRKEYALTLDMAKELSMVERNTKGREARRYFIAAEKALRQVLPQLALQIELPDVERININDVEYLHYWQFVHSISGHVGGSYYEKTEKYPNRFLKVNGYWYIEEPYAIEIATNRQLDRMSRKTTVLVPVKMPISQLRLFTS